MTGGIAIMVKTPSLSPIKTRLAGDIGRVRAESFYLLSAEAVASVALDAQAQGGPAAYWAVAEAGALHGDAWADLPRLAQGGGSLGLRMDHVYRSLLARHRYALLIGADTPQLTADSVLRAAQWLAATEPRLVLGRSTDGGFWLFGGNRGLPGAAWHNVRYSCEHTCAEFTLGMDSFGTWLELEMLTDADDARDLPTVQAALESLPVPTDAQQRLAQWLADPGCQSAEPGGHAGMSMEPAACAASQTTSKAQGNHDA